MLEKTKEHPIETSESRNIKSVRSRIHVDDLNVTSILSNRELTINVDHVVDKDEALILALGYKQELKREFTLWSVFSVSFSVLGLLPSIAATFDYQQLVIGLTPVSWILGLIFVASVSFSLAEVASAFPTSSGTPYATSQLTPKKYAPVMTWMCSFSNWFCQVTASPSVNYSGACMIMAVVQYNKTGTPPTNGQIYGVFTAIQLTHAFIACVPARWAAWFNTFGSAVNMIFLVIVFILLLAANKRDVLHEGASKFNSNSTAWELYNQTEFPSGIAMLMSFLGVIWAMSGYDSPFHLSEECSNASVAVPKAIALTSTFGGLVGFVFVITIAYTTYSLPGIAEDPQGLGQPYITYLSQILEKKYVNLASAFTIISSYCMGSSCLLTASRVTYAYARDGLFPLSRIWKKVNPVTNTPVYAVWVNFTIGQILLLLLFAGDAAIGAVFCVGGIAGFVSFTIPTLMKITFARNTFKPGPWNLGRWSTPIGFVSVAFVTVMLPILCFPDVTGKDLNANTMNWTAAVYFGPMLIAYLWFIIDAHKWYKGPRSNLDEADLEFNDIEHFQAVEVGDDSTGESTRKG